MAVVKKIGILSLGKVMAAVYGGFGLIIGAFLSLLALLGSALGAGASEQGGAAALAGLLFGAGAIIIAPLVYGVIGFIGGVITALIYNIAAGVVGGVEIDLQ